jgi:hypothetical protein
MSPKVLYFLGTTIGGTIGGIIPDLWHAGMFSGWGILLSTIGALVGVWAVYRVFIA